MGPGAPGWGKDWRASVPGLADPAAACFHGRMKNRSASRIVTVPVVAALVAVSFMALSCAPAPEPIAFPRIDRRPPPGLWGREPLAALPAPDPSSEDPFQVDLRSMDLSALDLSAPGSADILSEADFDTRTLWPPAERMPAGFDREAVMETGRNPGLGIRSLHACGIDGRGVGIAIIDQPLLTDHAEYAARLRLYEEISLGSPFESQMHGSAVASIAVGKTTGVAPGADLYYIAALSGKWDPVAGKAVRNFSDKAEAVRRVLEINRQLPRERRIRVISISVGWGPDEEGYREITAAVAAAERQGILVVSSSLEESFGFSFHGLGREPTADPERLESYGPGSWWEDFYWASDREMEATLLVPMDSRTLASQSGPGDYVFYRTGGWSWSIPWIAGLYALAAQADPSITPGRFWDLALETGRSIPLERAGIKREFGIIPDPVALVDALMKR